MKKLFALGIMICMFTAVGFSQSSATASAAATIFTPISIAKVAGGDMNFGTLASSGSGGTCVLAADGAGTRTPSAGITLMGGTPQAATFTVTGIAGQSYAITLPSAATTVSDGAATPHTMTIDSWTSDYTGTITGGSITLHVGATLNIGALQEAGVYTTANSGGSGDFTVTVNYN
ncbi:MAG TPA: DUF4402 domain-containing protein [Bacteroidales bacterium]|nr:DUF4402 domain-containing protein [Bacteroidales bacterium]